MWPARQLVHSGGVRGAVAAPLQECISPRSILWQVPAGTRWLGLGRDLVAAGNQGWQGVASSQPLCTYHSLSSFHENADGSQAAVAASRAMTRGCAHGEDICSLAAFEFPDDSPVCSRVPLRSDQAPVEGYVICVMYSETLHVHDAGGPLTISLEAPGSEACEGAGGACVTRVQHKITNAADACDRDQKPQQGARGRNRRHKAATGGTSPKLGVMGFSATSHSQALMPVFGIEDWLW